LLVFGCGPGYGYSAVSCGQLVPRNANEVLICNELGESVIARLELPDGSPPPSGWPSVVLLHGSGGLFESDDDFPCAETPEPQFRKWAELLTDEGYAVIMPASFYSRGFCDWGDDDMPDEFDDHERLIMRTFDAAAAGNYMCDDPRFDCSRMAVMGFSNGGSTTLMVMQENLRAAADERLHQLQRRPPFVGGIAYYPGCGLENQLPIRVDPDEIERFYYPSARVWVAHGSKDDMHDECTEIRDPQVEIGAQLRGVTHDMFETELYEGAKHGFDNADDDDREADREARDHANAHTLALLESWLGPTTGGF
jgi:dienelactone hydrolase